jgi:oligopeptide transport system permease protein
MISGHTYKSIIIQHADLPPRIPGLEKLGIFNGVEKGVNVYQKKGFSDIYYWFGTDTQGRDLFTRVWQGTRISLLIALSAVLIDIFIGMVYGLISGYFGGKVDMVMQRIAEILNGIPTLVVVTLLGLILPQGIASVIFALMITGWIGMEHIARAQVLKLKESEYILASKTLGAKDFAIIFKDILPNIFGQLIIMSMFSVPNAIFTESFLSFVGLGIQPPMASLGSLISEGYKSLTVYPYMITSAIIVLALLMLSFNLFADGLRDAFDPKMKRM